MSMEQKVLFVLFFLKAFSLSAENYSALSNLFVSLSSLSERKNFIDLSRKLPIAISLFQDPNLLIKVQNKVKESGLAPLRKVTPELVNRVGTQVISYYLDDKHFDFLKPLSTSQLEEVRKKQAGPVLNRILGSQKLHKELYGEMKITLNSCSHNGFKIPGSSASSIHKTTLGQQLEYMNKALEELQEFRLKIIQDPKNEVFSRLLKLVEGRDAAFGLNKVPAYPQEIIKTHANDLENFNNLALYFPPKLNEALGKNLKENIEGYQSLYAQITNIKDLDVFKRVLGNFCNRIKEELEQLDGMIGKFIESFKSSAREISFQRLIDKSIERAKQNNLTGPLKDFNPTLIGMQPHIRELILRKMQEFRQSDATRLYLFTGGPLINLFRSWQGLFEGLFAKLDELYYETLYKDQSRIKIETEDKFFEYASSPYGVYNEAVYSYILTPLLLEIAAERVPPSSELKVNRTLWANYIHILKELQTFRKNYLSKLEKLITMIETDPYKKELKNLLRKLDASHLSQAEDLYIEVVTTQFTLRNILMRVRDECLNHLSTNNKLTMFVKTITHEDGHKETETLVLYLKKHIQNIFNRALDDLQLGNIELEFKQAKERMTHASQDQELADALRRGLAGRRPHIASDDEEEEQIWSDED